jgi:hypothetical protein
MDMEAVLLLIVLLVVIAVCLVPPVLAMATTFILMRPAFERARDLGRGTVRYAVVVVMAGVGVLASGLITDAPYFELIPPLGISAVVLSALEERRQFRAESSLPHARALRKCAQLRLS